MDLQRNRLEFNDFDGLREALRGWQTEPVQLSPGPLDLVLATVSGSDFNVLRMSLAPRVADRSVVEAGQIGFVVAERPHVWCGIEIEPPALLIVPPGREHHSVLEPGFRSTEFFVSAESLAEHPLGHRLRAASFEPERSVFPVNDQSAHALRAATNAVLSPSGLSVLVAPRGTRQDCVRDRFLGLLDDIVAPHLLHPADRQRPNRCARYRLARAALREIDRGDALDVSPITLAADLGVTRRALEQAFKSAIGVSPAQYLIARRLSQVRSRLATKGSRVIDTAFDFGFHDPSRFARQYRRLFGELPSETLQRRRRAVETYSR